MVINFQLSRYNFKGILIIPTYVFIHQIILIFDLNKYYGVETKLLHIYMMQYLKEILISSCYLSNLYLPSFSINNKGT